MNNKEKDVIKLEKLSRAVLPTLLIVVTVSCIYFEGWKFACIMLVIVLALWKVAGIMDKGGA